VTPADYARLAARAYTEPPTIGLASSASRAVVFSPGVVGFPGTDNLACWLADLDARAVDVPGMGRLHAGFWDAFQAISMPLLALSAVDVTLGHSEGAALALLFGAQLCLAGRPPKAVYAFEPPRVSADGTIAALFAAHGVTLTLTQNGNDLVPAVPRLTEKWQHAAPLQKIGRAALPFPNVQDHYIDRVIAALATT
jgi:hypothetical protein